MKLTDKKKLYIKASEAYYNSGKPIMTDKEFDKLEREIAAEDPTWKQLKKTGIKVGKKVEVKLALPMPSLLKVYPETLDKWRAKQKTKHVLEMHKLDGSALQGEIDDCVWTKLVTRGDGILGKDISFLIPYLNLPKIKVKGHHVVRCEAVMKQKTFEKKYTKGVLGEDNGFDNARNLVAGLLNRQDASKALKDIDIVVLGVYGHEAEAGLDWAESQGLTTVVRSRAPVDADFEARLAKARKSSEYEIDGIVLVDRFQTFAYANGDKPKWITAFKVNDDADAVDATVTDIVWQLSRIGRWTPKIEIKPVKMKGVTVTYATAHNARWMNQRRIGVGAVVKLVRSGDVIPKIVGVVKKAAEPSHPPGDFYEEGVHYYATTKGKEAYVREIHHFMQTLGIEFIAAKSLEKLYDAGLTSVLHHVLAFGSRMKGYNQGIGDGMITKVKDEYTRVFQLEGVSLVKLMNASNCFESFGERKLQMVEQYFIARGDNDPMRVFVKMSAEQLGRERQRNTVASIKGMGDKSAEQFYDGLWKFITWFKPIAKTKLIKINPPVIETKNKVKGKMSGQKVSWTGYRDKTEEAWVEAQGGEVVSFGGKTTVLLYKEGGKTSTKIDKAQEKGIKAVTFNELKKVFK